jgi:glycosyltransferase involved in cell wall biosynthesis
MQPDIILRLVEQSVRVVVLTKASKASIEALHRGTLKHLLVIPHGVPDVPYVVAEEWDAGIGQKPFAPLRLITPGFFRPDKGLEEMLYALRNLHDCGYAITYWIAGEPQRQFPEQWAYRERIERLVSSLRLDPVVQIEGRYLSTSEQRASIQESHLGVFPYQLPAWTSSGTIPLVMSMGRPVLCTAPHLLSDLGAGYRNHSRSTSADGRRARVSELANEKPAVGGCFRKNYVPLQFARLCRRRNSRCSLRAMAVVARRRVA